MQISFRYPGIPPLEVPDANLMGQYRPREVTPRVPARALVEEALAAPIGSPRLSVLARPGDRVLILSDDYTRPTPVAEMLPPVLDELRSAGVEPANIKILIASGTHRPMTPEELAHKLGPDVVAHYEVLAHRWDDPAQQANLGQTPGGLPIILDRRLLEADLVVGLGHIVPHRVTGYSGGAKIVEPGVEGQPEGTHEMHWLAAQVPGHEVLGVIDNPIRIDIDEMARPAGLRFIVNAIQDGVGKVAAIVAGDPGAAYRQGCPTSREIYGAHLPTLADIVVIDSYPADVDFWQAGKAVYASELAVRPGGVVILVTPCPEGVAHNHPAVLQFGVRPVAELRHLVETGELQDIIAAAILALTAWVVAERATGIMVSPGIAPAEQRQLRFTPARTPQEALGLAFEQLGREAQVAVLQHGGEILPLAPERAEAAAAAGERAVAG